ncbi:MAG: VOC family protein [bacterium]|nr:VOC family protein [bacterium]
MIHAIDHTAISVPDLDEAVDFYTNVLGFEVESESGWPRGAARVDQLVGLRDSSSKVAMVRLGDTRIEIFQYVSPTPNVRDPGLRVCDHGITHFCLRVTGIEDEYARLEAAGVEFNGPPVDVGSSICVYGRDPFGNVIELKQQKP